MRVGVIAQTTGNLEKLQQVVARLVNLVKDVKVLNTICGDTIPRLKQSRQVAEQAEAVIVRQRPLHPTDHPGVLRGK